MEQAVRKRDPGQVISRLIMTGMDFPLYFRLMLRTETNLITQQKTENPEDFLTVAEQMADAECEYAKKQLELGNTYAAGEAFFAASQIYKMADYGLTELTEEKLRLYKKCSDSFREGVPLLEPHKSYPVEIPFEGNSMPGMLTIPTNATPDVPVVITIPGATGFKEENWFILKRIQNAGLATLIFDGPGQGEALFLRNMLYTVDNFERAVDAVIDFVRMDDRVGNRVAVYGNSYGGYLAARAACFLGDKIDCVVARGGCAKTSDLANKEKDLIYLKKFMLKFNETDADRTMAIIDQMTIEPHVENITIPLLVVNGDPDPVLGSQGSRFIHEHAASQDKELLLVPRAGHNAGGDNTHVEHHIAAWLKRHLS